VAENLIEQYLTELADIRGTRSNAPETSFYPALERLLTGLGDSRSPVAGVTTGKICDELKAAAVFQRVDGKPAQPDTGDLDLTAGWGHAAKGGVTMPGMGKRVRRDDGACDVFLNDVACWRNIPEPVWDYTIGGYQIIKRMIVAQAQTERVRLISHDEVVRKYLVDVEW
jgi:hypothetical protein